MVQTNELLMKYEILSHASLCLCKYPHAKRFQYVIETVVQKLMSTGHAVGLLTKQTDLQHMLLHSTHQKHMLTICKTVQGKDGQKSYVIAQVGYIPNLVVISCYPADVTPFYD